ncbi:hypothetical protein [Sporomusa acidovorans]|uniref:Uncharacterized protein n=1 Tax=Sporomusa acidovorans (strain ATCC 49682 / DSM 3132 / Mol) TaxID=1123286 RepID=A0ABZ3JAI5_SPOA4|nr:hypothetical protein [Sporomusa acidovorans]OZC15129.1 hypothetical protein SPACI_50410 [Sporomusa acidovorans DSM 3132]SDF44333.1 hypothetical protein SAMN04488499_104937 [Sporomusa acidovorans]
MTSRDEDRLNWGCILGNIRATVVTRCGIVYQGTIEDWNCSGLTSTRPDSSSSDSNDSQKEESSDQRGDGHCGGPRFIRMTVECIPGNICCPMFDADDPVGASRVTPILGFTGPAETLYTVPSDILINWDDVSSLGIASSTACLTDTTA